MLKILPTMSFYGSLVGLVALALSLIAKHIRVSRGVVLLFWALAGLRLLGPMELTSDFSVWQRTALEQSVPAAIISEPVVNHPEGTHTQVQTPEAKVQPSQAVKVAQPQGQLSPKASSVSLSTVLIAVWAFGAGLLLTWGIMSYWLFRRRLRFAMRLGSGVYEVDTISTPCVAGILRPRVYLPVGLTDLQRQYIIAHERAHIRGGDHIWKLLSYLVLSVHWFNPLVWLEYFRFQQDLEMACDERALKGLGLGARADYSETLLVLAKRRRVIALNPVAFSEHPVKERIMGVLRHKKPLISASILAIAASIILTACLAASPAKEAAPGEATSPTETTVAPTELTRPTESQPQRTPVEINVQPVEAWPQGTWVDDDTMKELKALFADPQSWPVKVLTSDFMEPKEIDLSQLFYTGIPGADNELRENERAYLEPQWEDMIMLDCYRIFPEQMDEILKTYLGISFRDTLGVGLENFTYWEETDCYYKCGGGANVRWVRIHSAYAQEDGTIALCYSTAGSPDFVQVDPPKVAVLRPVGAGYQILSNRPVNPEQVKFIIDSRMEVRRQPEEITVYPFTQEELDSAQQVVERVLDEFSQEPGVLSQQVVRIAFDPIMTDVHVRQIVTGAPVDGWVEKDYYKRHISFAVTYFAAYNHEETFMQDVNDNVIKVDLYRENANSPWEYESGGVPVEQYSGNAMSAQELEEISVGDGRILGGYAVDNEYWLYLWDEGTGTIRFVQQGQ